MYKYSYVCVHVLVGITRACAADLGRGFKHAEDLFLVSSLWRFQYCLLFTFRATRVPIIVIMFAASKEDCGMI